MPEGHTIHRLARDQTADLAGHVVHATSSQDRFRAGAARLDGLRHEGADAWGKHLFHDFASGEILYVHLGLIGTFTRRSATIAPGPTVRLRLAAGDVAWDLIGPMTCSVITPDERDAVVAKLGPDPLRPDADRDLAWARIHRSDKPIGLLLMEQDVIAGIGNVYRSELCNIVGIDPRRAGRAVDRGEFDALWREAAHQLRLGVRRNRIVTMRADELPVPVARLPRGEGRYAYKQERCGRCHTELDVYPIAGRTTWSCPVCQPG